jgi:hypothetical protein
MGMSTPLPVIEVDPINVMPVMSAQDLVVDQAQIEQPQRYRV